LKDEKLSLQIGQEKPEQLERSNQQIKNAKKKLHGSSFLTTPVDPRYSTK